MKPGPSCLLALVLLLSCPLAHPQAYPVRPVRLVIGSFAGGGIDLAGRIVAQKMSESRRHGNHWQRMRGFAAV